MQIPCSEDTSFETLPMNIGVFVSTFAYKKNLNLMSAVFSCLLEG